MVLVCQNVKDKGNHMADKTENKLQSLFSKNGKADDSSLPEPEVDEDLGPCAAIAKNRWITALTIRNSKAPWVSFIYSYMGVRAEFEPTRFTVEFVSHDERYKVIVTGRNLGRLYNLILQARLEWIRVADRPGFADDGDSVIEKIEVVKVETKH